MKQRVFCVACGAHAFDYEGDVYDGAVKSAKATFPDGSHPVEGSAVLLPCTHAVRFCDRDLRVEVLE